MPSTSLSSSATASSSLTVTHGQATLTTTSAVKELTRLLHEYGDKILAGKAMLSLTTESLAVLNNGFDAIRENREDKSFDVLPPNYSPLTVLPELQFIHDFVQKTPSLRLVHGNNTIQGCVSLQTFRSLTHLEMRRIPVHLLQGLQRVRPKLVVLSVERCLHQLQDLFEAMSPPESAVASLSWGALEKVYLPYNFVEHLDGSLRLLPLVKVLDISHNCLKSTDAYLGYLTELIHLNLSYNSLPAIPSLSMSSRTRLVTIVLANNHIDSLTGLEILEALEILDLSNNLLCDHGGLVPLRRLGSLKELYLAFNPIAYHKQHRGRTTPYVAPIVLHTLKLDGAPFSAPELAHGRSMLVGRRLPAGASAAGSRWSTVSGSRASLLANMEEDPDLTANGNALDSLTLSLQSRASVRRIRSIQVNEIEDVGEGCDGGSGRRGGSESEARRIDEEPAAVAAAALNLRAAAVQNEIASARREMEQRRRQLGDSWLTSLVTSTPISAPRPQSVPPERVAAAAGISSRQPAANGLPSPVPLLPEVASGSVRPQSVASGLLRQQLQHYHQSQPLLLQPQQQPISGGSLYSSPVSTPVTSETTHLPAVLPSDLAAAATKRSAPGAGAGQASLIVMPGIPSRADKTVAASLPTSSAATGLPVNAPPSSVTLTGRPVEPPVTWAASADTPVRAGEYSKDARAAGMAGRSSSNGAPITVPASTGSALTMVAAGTTAGAAPVAAHAAVQPALLPTDVDVSKPRTSSAAAESDPYLRGDDDDDDIDVVWKDVIEDDEVDGADEELFIVYPLHPCPAGGSLLSSAEPCFVTIRGHYLTEKDHNGHASEKLDLRMLLLAGIAPSEDPKDNIVVNLQFNYVRKDRRERHYVMEDVQSAEHFMALLSPMLKLRQQSIAAAAGDSMQCLRCNHTFAKEAADVRVHHKEEQTAKATAISEVLHCPSCGSPHVVKHEVDHRPEYGHTAPQPQLPRTGSVGSLLSAAAGAGSPVQFDSALTSPRVTTPDRPADSHSGPRVLPHKRRLVASAGGTPLYGSLCNVSESTSYYSLAEDDAQSVGASGSYRPVGMLAAAGTWQTSGGRLLGSTAAGGTMGQTLSSSSSEHGSHETLVPGAQGSAKAAISDSLAASHAQLQAVISKMQSSAAAASAAGMSAANQGVMAAEASRPRGHSSFDLDDNDGEDATLMSTNATAMITAAESHSLDAGGQEHISTTATGMQGHCNHNVSGERGAVTTEEAIVREKATAGSCQVASADDSVVIEESLQLTFHFDDFTIVDHRLKLFLAMEHFADDETCECILLSTAVQHNTAMHFVSILALSSAAIYVFKIARQHSKRMPPGGTGGGTLASEPDLAGTITLVERQPLAGLCYVDSALNHQNFRLEFERSGYCFLVRDALRCKSFVALLTGVVRRVAFDPSCRLQAIAKIHSEYLECFSKWIQDDDDADVGSGNGSGVAGGDAGGLSDAVEPYYCMALLRGSGDPASKTTSAVAYQEADSSLDGLEPVSIFLTDSGLHVLKENCYLPLSRCGSSESTKKSYFNLRFRLRVSDVSQVNVFDDMPRDVEVETFNESSPTPELPLQSSCRFVMATRAAALAFINALSGRWQALFGIELQVDSLRSGAMPKR